MNIELANGSEGYIPPPEQHMLGGYTTWPARDRSMESRRPSRRSSQPCSSYWKRFPRKTAACCAGMLADPYAHAVLASRPIAYWRLEDMQGANRI